eukprot:141851-Pleurochrysis_carterae.AAC.2
MFLHDFGCGGVGGSGSTIARFLASVLSSGGLRLSCRRFTGLLVANREAALSTALRRSEYHGRRHRQAL